MKRSACSMFYAHIAAWYAEQNKLVWSLTYSGDSEDWRWFA